MSNAKSYENFEILIYIIRYNSFFVTVFIYSCENNDPNISKGGEVYNTSQENGMDNVQHNIERLKEKYSH